MKYVYLILLVAGFFSCSSVSNTKSVTHTEIHHATRRADYGKYIVKEQHVAGSRNLFIQPGGSNCLNSSQAVSKFLEGNMHDKNRDVFLVILLDAKNLILNVQELLPEILSAPSMYSSEITAYAVESGAVSVILVQSQPSRSSIPRSHDRDISNHLKLALESIDVGLLDYLIVGRNRCFSFADNNFL